MSFSMQLEPKRDSKIVRWVYCPTCDIYGYGGFNLHTKYYCTTVPTTYFDYRSVRERPIRNEKALIEPTFEQYMQFFNIIKK